MRKTLLFTLMAAVLLSLLGMSMVAAQDKTPITFGEYVEGSITNKDYEFKYTFEGEKGQIVAVEMLPTPGTYDLDPYIILRDSDGDVLAENDDFGYPLSLVVAELPANETYTILATRSSGSTGTSEGSYWLKASLVEPVTSGAKIEATIVSDSEKATPNYYIMRPESSGPLTVGFSQDISDLFASVKVSTWNTSYGGEDTIAELDNTAKVTNASFTVDLDGGTFYVLRVDRAFGSYSFVVDEATVKVTLD
ncbi:MAG: hypothetical protein R3E39_16290 [Anaerolineae bacterium]